MTLNIVPFAAMGSANADFLYANVTGSGTNASVPFGPADSSRNIVVGVGSGASGVTVSGVTVAGVTATQLVSHTNSTNRGYLFIAPVPSGTSGTIAISGSGLVYKVAAYAMYEASSTLIDTVASSNDGNSIDVTDGGVVIAFRFHFSGGGTSWTGVSEDDDQTSGTNGNLSCAHAEFASAATGQTLNGTGGSLHSPVIVAASFGP